MKRLRTDQKGKQHTDASFARNILKGFLFELLIGMLLLLAFAIYIYRSNDPDAVLIPCTFISLYLTAFIGGFATARINKNGSAICGGITGILTLLLLGAIFPFIPTLSASPYSSSANTLLHFAILPLSLAGALLAGRVSERKSLRRKHKIKNKNYGGLK